MQLAILGIGVLSLVAIYVSQLTPDQKWVFLGLIALVGFCVGGIFNLYLNHEIILLTERNGEDISMNLNIVHGIAMLFAALSEVIVGFFSSLNMNSIFLVFLAFAAIGFSSILWRVFLQCKRDQEEGELASDDSD